MDKSREIRDIAIVLIPGMIGSNLRYLKLIAGDRGRWLQNIREAFQKKRNIVVFAVPVFSLLEMAGKSFCPVPIDSLFSHSTKSCLIPQSSMECFFNELYFLTVSQSRIVKWLI